VPKDSMTYAKITDLFTNDEIDRAKRLFLECNTSDEFYRKCTKEVAEPVLSRVNECTGHRNSAEYWAFCLAI
jgi:hypothetical protein